MNAIEEKKGKLETDIEEFWREYKRRGKRNLMADATFIVVALLCTVCVTLAVLFDQPKVAAVLGLGATFLIGFENAIPLAEIGHFFRVVAAEGKNLQVILRDSQTDAEYNDVRDQFVKLRQYAEEGVPRGQGMDVVRKMKNDLSKK